MKKVYIPNKSGHDFSAAEKFGELVYLTRGNIDRFGVTNLYREIIEGMEEATEHDFWLISSLAIVNSIGCAILARKFGKVNFLIFKEGIYVERTLDIDSLLFEEV